MKAIRLAWALALCAGLSMLSACQQPQQPDVNVTYKPPTGTPAVDTDNDGLSDLEEAAYGTSPVLRDTDGDGLGDYEEVMVLGTNPTLMDSDNDGLTDYEEAKVFKTSPILDDTDDDGLSDYDEVKVYFTSALLPDTDGDLLSDFDEIHTYATSPVISDTDHDGLSDYEEVVIYHTNPLVADMDHDGLNDFDEVVTYGTDPTLADMDNDGISDYDEVKTYGTSPSLADTDSDGLNDFDELFVYHTNPRLSDTDGDGISDSTEVLNGTSPTLSDTDGDGLDDSEEISAGTSPILSDTDGDGFSDWDELVRFGFDPAVNPLKFNPLVADLPLIEVSIQSAPEIYLNLTNTQGDTKTFSTSHETGTVHTDQNNSTVTWGVEVEAGFKYSWKDGAEVHVNVTGSWEWAYGEEHADETHNLYTYEQAYEKSNQISESGGGVMMTLMARNTGNFSFRIENLIMSLTLPDLNDHTIFHPIGNLILDTNEYTHFPQVTIGPGDSLGPLPFINDHLDLTTAKTLLDGNKARVLCVTPAVVELVDEKGVPFNFNLTDVNARDAEVMIDYAGYLPSEQYAVAANGNPLHPGITAQQALAILGIPFQTTASAAGGMLSGLRDNNTVTANPVKNGFWIVQHQRFNGLNTTVTRYYPTMPGGYDFGAIELKAGDKLFLIYIEDKDNDGILVREEQAQATSDTSTDSDSDGLPDQTEEELNTSPANHDTDGDMLDDGIDPDPLHYNYFDISAGRDFSLMVKTDGTLWSWGRNTSGQLGQNRMENYVASPGQVAEGGWAQVSAGLSHAAGIKSDGTLWTWGENTMGELGLGGGPAIYRYPQWVAADTDWAQVSAGQYQTHALKADGQHYAFGYGLYGQLGDGDTSNENTPKLISAGTRSMQVDAGGYFHLALGSDGKVWASGYADHGALGNTVSGNVKTPVQTQAGDTAWDYFVYVSAPPMSYEETHGSSFYIGNQGFAIRWDGTLFAWGDNYYGQLGVNSMGYEYDLPAGVGTGWWLVDAGVDHTLGVRNDHTIWAWGHNYNGQLGQGHNTWYESSNRNKAPQRVFLNGKIVRIAAGDSYSMAVRSDGTVWAWGKNNYGQLGNGTTIDSYEPVCIGNVVPGKGCMDWGKWKKVAGSEVPTVAPVFGTLKVPSSANTPGSRINSATFTDSQGNLWLFGGTRYNGSYSNDLWKFDITQNTWTWMNGDTASAQYGVYGQKGVSSPSNKPGARLVPQFWTDQSGNFWMFGGMGLGRQGSSYGNLNDLWKYDVSLDMWTWMSGDSVTDQLGVYGQKGVPSSLNKPGARCEAGVAVDSFGNFWVYGGSGYDSVGPQHLSDLWKYDPNSNQWTWVSGASSGAIAPVQGTKGVPSLNNTPGARVMTAAWVDNFGNFWLFGGLAPDGITIYNCLWKFDGNSWTWMNGGTPPSPGVNYGIYGNLGNGTASTTPGSRWAEGAWKDAHGDLWIFGGTGVGEAASGLLNDVWRYDVSANTWVWEAGSKSLNLAPVYSGNVDPGARFEMQAWVDSQSNLWMYGGRDNASARRADLWKYTVK